MMDRLLAQVLVVLMLASSQAHGENFQAFLAGSEQEQDNLYRQLRASQGEPASQKPSRRQKLQKPSNTEGSEFQIRLVPKQIHKRTFVAKAASK